MPRFIDRTGTRYERLVVIEKAINDVDKNTKWLCLCDCGKYIVTYGCNLTSGKTQSCGCLLVERRSTGNITHGMRNTKQYRVWLSMKQRCCNPSNKNYTRYGGRGVEVCQEWHSFESFWEDMSEGYAEGLSLDRIDNNLGYCKDNCRWTDASEQGYNKGLVSTNKSGKTGVSFVAATGKWVAYIKKHQKSIHLGVFTSFEAAVKAREEAELEYFGYNKE